MRTEADRRPRLTHERSGPGAHGRDARRKKSSAAVRLSGAGVPGRVDFAVLRPGDRIDRGRSAAAGAALAASAGRAAAARRRTVAVALDQAGRARAERQRISDRRVRPVAQWRAGRLVRADDPHPGAARVEFRAVGSVRIRRYAAHAVRGARISPDHLLSGPADVLAHYTVSLRADRDRFPVLLS